MSEDMSDRMPEDLPVRTCINVMVGITRSKVFFFNPPQFTTNPCTSIQAHTMRTAAFKEGQVIKSIECWNCPNNPRKTMENHKNNPNQMGLPVCLRIYSNQNDNSYTNNTIHWHFGFRLETHPGEKGICQDTCNVSSATTCVASESVLTWDWNITWTQSAPAKYLPRV